MTRQTKTPWMWLPTKTNSNQAMTKVFLCKRVIVTDDIIFDAERELDLPVPPVAGMRLYNTEWRPPGCDDSEDQIEEIGYDHKTGRVLCFLPADDFRAEASGWDGWTEEDARKRYRDWTLKRDKRLMPKSS